MPCKLNTKNKSRASPALSIKSNLPTIPALRDSPTGLFCLRVCLCRTLSHLLNRHWAELLCLASFGRHYSNGLAGFQKIDKQFQTLAGFRHTITINALHYNTPLCKIDHRTKNNQHKHDSHQITPNSTRRITARMARSTTTNSTSFRIVSIVFYQLLFRWSPFYRFRGKWQRVVSTQHNLADSIGFEPMHRLLDDGLAIRCINHSANYPMVP